MGGGGGGVLEWESRSWFGTISSQDKELWALLEGGGTRRWQGP